MFDGLSAITAGILRAIGKQFTGALLNLSAYYVVGKSHLPSLLSYPTTAHVMLLAGIPFGIWLAFWRDMELHGLWIGLTVSLVYCAATGVYICFRADWTREVEKVRRRLEADRKHALDAAIVRVMKAKKELNYEQLKTATIEAVRKHFVPEVGMIKQRIQGLVEQEYLRRDEDDMNVLHYVA